MLMYLEKPRLVLGNVKPLRAGNSTIIIQKGGEKVKEITFDLDTDGLLGVDLTVLADHLARGGLTRHGLAARARVNIMVCSC
jgi:hypothetical protein